MTGRDTSVAVVIPTRNRPELLRQCLQALALQTMPPAEVVVVDDAGSGSVHNLAQEFRGRLAVRALRLEVQQGPGQARNAGWRAANADLIAFTDDDCRPDPTWVEVLANNARDRLVLVGRTVSDAPAARARWVTDHEFAVDTDDGRFSTCNVAYPRRLLEQLGGFDPAFRMLGEDTDLGQRALREGASSQFLSHAVVRHAVLPRTLAQAVHDTRRLQDAALLVSRYPELRRRVLDGAFYRRSHRATTTVGAALLLAAAALARLGLSGPALGSLALLPIVPFGLSGAVIARRPQDAFRAAVLNAAEMYNCARGSIRHREVLL